MAIVSPFVKQFITAAASIAIIQGIVWLILSFMVIFLYTEVWKPRIEGETYGQLLSDSIIEIYFQGYNSLKLFVTPIGLFVWAIIYAIASIVWTCISVYLLIALKNERRTSLRKRCQQWCYWTGLICVMDLVLASLLARDYNYLVRQLNLNPISLVLGTYSYMPLAIGVVMTLAARGFVLWILNITFAAVIGILPVQFLPERPQV